MNYADLRPKNRSRARIQTGKLYYTVKRHAKWMFGKERFAKNVQKTPLPYKTTGHETLLLRRLKDVDMWYQHNKIVNLRIAVRKLNGILIRPGETFSYWKLIGKPTKGKGYIPGMVLHYGTFTSGIGGGLCQLSNLIYWMTLHTPLTVTERHRHSFDVFPDSRRTQPFGSGATCAYNYLDLQIANRTDKVYQLVLKVTDSHLTGEWRCEEPSLYKYEVYEKDHEITPAYWGGYLRHNTICRRIFNRQDELVDDEYVTENHAIMMYEPLLESGT